MLVLSFAALLLVDPFWITKAPQQWSDPELVEFLTASPWAQFATGPANSAQVLVFLATAGPMLQAEEERERRGREKRRLAKLPEPDDELAGEYKLWLEDNRPTQVVLAVRVPNAKAFSDQKEIRQMEEGSVMRSGRNKTQMTGHFPPSGSDPYLRLAFPRKILRSEDKSVSFDLYIPGLAIPFRHLEFSLKDLLLNGRLEL